MPGKEKIIIGGILGHAGGGYGFKLTFEDTKMAKIWKNMIIQLAEEQGFKIETANGYHDGGH